ncbi:hypothetical protein GCM10025734_78430 [Kitasatospora paranensis]
MDEGGPAHLGEFGGEAGRQVRQNGLRYGQRHAEALGVGEHGVQHPREGRRPVRRGEAPDGLRVAEDRAGDTCHGGGELARPVAQRGPVGRPDPGLRGLPGGAVEVVEEQPFGRGRRTRRLVVPHRGYGESGVGGEPVEELLGAEQALLVGERGGVGIGGGLEYHASAVAEFEELGVLYQPPLSCSQAVTVVGPRRSRRRRRTSARAAAPSGASAGPGTVPSSVAGADTVHLGGGGAGFGATHNPNL